MKIENGNLIIELNDIWNELPADTKAEFLQEAGAWEVLEQELLYLQGSSLSTPSFYNSIHKVRELILTSSEFVDEMLVSFVKTCLEEWAKEKQKCYAAERAYWKLYHQLDWDTRQRKGIEAKAPLDFRKESTEDWNYAPSINKNDIQKEILDAFGEIIDVFITNKNNMDRVEIE